MERTPEGDKSPASLSAFVLEYHPALRAFLVSGLQSAGFSRVDTSTDPSIAEKAMLRRFYDFILFDSSRDIVAITESIKAARQNLSERDPFGVYVMTGPAPTGNGVEQIVNSGCDTFIVRPFTEGLMQARLKHLFESNRNFVVTTHYIGPERRKTMREETFTRRVSVPNTLKAKSDGNFDPEAHRKAMDRALLRFNTFLVERQAHLIELLEDSDDQNAQEELRKSEQNILLTVRKLAKSLEVTGHDKLQPLVVAISETAGERIARNNHIGSKAARELQSLCGHLANFLNGDS